MAADYLVLCFKGAPAFDAMPIMKVTHYPYERESYKPFAQGIICMQENKLIMRLWAFEAKPEAVSELAVALKGPSGSRFTLSVRLDGKACVCLDGDATTLPIEIRPIAGEDLQGEYWGVDVALSVELTRALGLNGSGEGTVLNGNFYKLCEGERPHFGSFFPTDSKDITAFPATFMLAIF